MKRIIAGALALMFLACLIGCGNTKEGPSGGNPTQNPVAQFNGEKIKLNSETSFRDLHFRMNYDVMHKDTMGSVCQVTVLKDGDVACEIFFVYYEGKTVADVMSESPDVVLTEKTIGDQVWSTFPFETNGMTGQTYVASFGGSSYTVSFRSPYDTSALEDALMKTVRFAEE